MIECSFSSIQHFRQGFGLAVSKFVRDFLAGNPNLAVVASKAQEAMNLRDEPPVWTQAIRSISATELHGRGPTATFEVFHEYPLEFEGYLLSCAKMPGAKESDPD
jgi:hypothetical protein